MKVERPAPKYEGAAPPAQKTGNAAPDSVVATTARADKDRGAIFSARRALVAGTRLQRLDLRLQLGRGHAEIDADHRGQLNHAESD